MSIRMRFKNNSTIPAAFTHTWMKYGGCHIVVYVQNVSPCFYAHAHISPTTSSLLAMAEAFLGQAPPRISDAVRCLLAVLTLHPPPRIEAQAHLELGLTLYHHTNNLLEAREHLDKAVSPGTLLESRGELILFSTQLGLKYPIIIFTLVFLCQSVCLSFCLSILLCVYGKGSTTITLF